jgi:hypothetical protein
MIKTQAYNDFSSFSIDQKMDYNFMLEQIKSFKENGGDISLMVREYPGSHDKIELTTFRDYIIKNIDNSEEFFNELMKEKVISGICDFKWIAETGTIQETEGYGITWMKNNYDAFSGMILDAVHKLLKEIPDDLSKIETFNHFENGKATPRSFYHPLFTIANDIGQEDVYKAIFEARPEIKKEWMEIHRDGEPRFLRSIGAQYYDVKNPSLGVLFYKYGIGRDYLHQTENLDKLHQLIVYAVRKNDIEFLNEVLPKVNLQEMEQNKDSSSLTLVNAKNAEMANFLMDHKAVISTKRTLPHVTVDIDVVFSQNFHNIDVLKVIFERDPYYKNLIKEDPACFYRHMEDKKFDLTKTLVENYQFPLENFDMLFLAYKKGLEISEYKWLLQNGADVRECNKFCEKIVSSRDEGLKTLRALNKEGIIVSKSPDIVFNIFENSPTKIFLTYYDKLTSTELEKTTKKGLPAWWGAKHVSDYNFMFRRVKNFDQHAQDGKPLYFYLLERELEHSKTTKPKEVLEMQFKKLQAQEPEYLYDLSYTDKDGNNFMHHFLKIARYKKDNIDTDLLKFFVGNGKQHPFEFLQKENNEGVTPLEILLTQEYDKNYRYNLSQMLRTIAQQGLEYVDLNKKLTNGQTLADCFAVEVADKELSTKVQAIALEQLLAKKEETPNRKLKI